MNAEDLEKTDNFHQNIVLYLHDTFISAIAIHAHTYVYAGTGVAEGTPA